jgi:murein DD-endopeptidase MepM/ murein hydrolase activator NlpD
LHISIHTSSASRDIAQPVEIHEAHYRTGKLSVAPKFVEPGASELQQIAADSEIKTRVFAASAGETLWRGSFRAPVRAAPTDSFGTRRMFNGKLASVHKGMDFRAPMGTIVHAANSGVVCTGTTALLRGKLRHHRSRLRTVHALHALQPH